MQDGDAPIWLPRLAVQGGPRFLQIADALQVAVADGSLTPGDPSSASARVGNTTGRGPHPNHARIRRSQAAPPPGVRKEARLRHRMAGTFWRGGTAALETACMCGSNTGLLERLAACACHPQRRHCSHAGGGIRHWQRVRECHSDLVGQHRGPWTFAGRSSKAVSSACSGPRAFRRCWGLAVHESPGPNGDAPQHGLTYAFSGDVFP